MRCFIGLVLYAITFLYYDDIFNKMADKSRDLVHVLEYYGVQASYTKWFNLLHIDDKLVFMGFIIIGRIIWLIFEVTFFSFSVLVICRAQEKP